MSSLQHEYLHGELLSDGWQLDWYGLYAVSDGGAYDCSSIFSAGYVYLIFNLSGSGVVMGHRTRLSLVPSTMAMCFPQNEIMASRIAGGANHEFVVLTMSIKWLKKILLPKSI